jgi:hypothetical protein
MSPPPETPGIEPCTVEAAAPFRALIDGPVDSAYDDPARLDELRAIFCSEGYVRLPGLLSREAMAIVRDEVRRLEPSARSRDFVMPGPETPRVMSVLGATQLARESPALAMLYVHFELVRVVSSLAAAPVYCCGHPEELMVCNFLLSDGATHGWHLDDPAYALVVVLEAPGVGCGGALEYIADWDSVCARLGHHRRGPAAAAVAHAHALGMVERAHHAADDAYLLRADRCLHRVAPLDDRSARRVALNFAYEHTRVPAYGESANALYGPARVPRRGVADQ